MFERAFGWCFAAITICIASGCSSETTTPVESVRDAADAPPDTMPDAGEDAVPDAGSAETACRQQGGMCVDAYPGSDPPGFTVFCPSGYALDNGQTSTTNGGSNMIDSELAFGCSRNPDGTTKPSLCCFPVTDAATD